MDYTIFKQSEIERNELLRQYRRGEKSFKEIEGRYKELTKLMEKNDIYGRKFI